MGDEVPLGNVYVLMRIAAIRVGDYFVRAEPRPNTGLRGRQQEERGYDGGGGPSHLQQPGCVGGSGNTICMRRSVSLLSKPIPTVHTHVQPTANAEAGLGDYAAALKDYRKAAQMQPGYVFPLASAALTLYQLVCRVGCAFVLPADRCAPHCLHKHSCACTAAVSISSYLGLQSHKYNNQGQDAEAQKQMRLLLVKYPELVDMRAALAVLYWKQGELAKAEGEWYNTINEDPRYRRIEWVRSIRRWPPRMVQELGNFLEMKLPSAAAAAGPPAAGAGGSGKY